jgi:hypothetical protein
MPAIVFCVLAFFLVAPAQASDAPGFRLPLNPQAVQNGSVQLLFFGGSDCPVCRAWQAAHWPQWQASPEAKLAQFVFIDKTVKMDLNAIKFWPNLISPALRQSLIKANGARRGSPQMALVVNGELVDFFYGPREASTLAAMVRGARGESLYPSRPCLQLGPSAMDECSLDGPAEQLR